MYVKSYKELIVWQRSVQVVEHVYILTRKFPTSELYGIVSQMRRASISISSNIAEGYGRKSSKEYYQFFSIAYGSALELETQIIISKRLQLVSQNEFHTVEALLEEVLRMLNHMTHKMDHRSNLITRR